MFFDTDDNREIECKILLAKVLVASNDFVVLAQRTPTHKRLESMSYILGVLIDTTDELERNYAEYLTPEVVQSYEDVIFTNSNLLESIRESFRG